MTKRPNQMTTGKAFEYALLKELKEKLEGKTKVDVIKNNAFETAKECFAFFSKEDQAEYLLYASFTVNFLMDIEPRLSNDLGKNDVLQLEIATDQRGQQGDVRDLLIIRLLQKWEIGISAKNNHRAVKHSRLSNNIDFGQKWLGLPCGAAYFNEIKPVFDMLAKIKQQSKSTKKWSSIQNKETTVYRPVLAAFKKELNRLYQQSPKHVAQQLVEYLIGKDDYYKVIKLQNKIEIQAFNLHGTLNQPFEDAEPKFVTPKVCLPDEINSISFMPNKNTTLQVNLNKGWKLTFRIHNASSKIEPSLKFDISVVEKPKTLFVNTLSISGV